MGNFDQEHPALVQLGCDGAHLVRGIAVGDGVGAVPQGGVNDVDGMGHIIQPP